MPIEFSPVPLINKVLVSAQIEAAANGHVIEEFTRERQSKNVTYTARCRICGADIDIVCTSHKYSREGSAYDRKCKPG